MENGRLKGTIPVVLEMLRPYLRDVNPTQAFIFVHQTSPPPESPADLSGTAQLFGVLLQKAPQT
jgi:hypothetical protein